MASQLGLDFQVATFVSLSLPPLCQTLELIPALLER
jgi:hypothetical protein